MFIKLKFLRGSLVTSLGVAMREATRVLLLWATGLFNMRLMQGMLTRSFCLITRLYLCKLVNCLLSMFSDFWFCFGRRNYILQLCLRVSATFRVSASHWSH